MLHIIGDLKNITMLMLKSGERHLEESLTHVLEELELDVNQKKHITINIMVEEESYAI